jgi:hypothetical protein
VNQLVFQLLGHLSFFCLRKCEVEPVEVCIKENKTDCVWLAVLDMNETEGDRRATDARHNETARNH